MEEEGREAPGNRQVFISYARGDAAEWAGKLAQVLREHSFQPWLDTEHGVDKSGIPIGAPFDIHLEIGIEGSQLLIALLSPFSLQQESFCRNELLFALHRKVPIVPVRVAEVTPPIQIIALNYLDALQDPEGVLAKLPQLLERVLREGRYGEREWPSPEERKGEAWWFSLRRLDFSEELGRYGGDFVGREWLFREIGEWIAQPQSRLLLLTAEAGFGKSALAAQLTTRWNVRGVHFCSRSQVESCRPEAWLKGLIEQLARQCEPYREAVRKIPEPDWNSRGESLFRTLVADPLRACPGDLPVDKPWVLVVDGLDEALAETGMSNSLAALLADIAKPEREAWPSWLRLVATARPDERLLPLFRGRCQPIALDAGRKENQEDLLLFLRREVQSLQTRGFLVEGEAAGRSVIEEIHRLAAGNFLYAEQALKALGDPVESNRLRVEELGKLPPGLGGLYHEIFRKRFGEMDVYVKQALPLLECLVAAREALPENLLLVSSGLEEGIARRSLRLLSQFLHREGGEDGVGGPVSWRLHHQSLADWLTEEKSCGDFFVPAGPGHCRLAEVGLAECREGVEGISPYLLSHLVVHLIRGQRREDWDWLERLLTDLRYLEARCRAGQAFALVRECQEAMEALPEGRKEDEIRRQRQTELDRYSRELVEYGRRWSEARERHAQDPEGYPMPREAEIPLPRIESVRPWSDQEIEADCQRIRSNPTRLDRIRAFAQFIGGDSYNLSQYAHQANYLAQLAYNSACDGPVAEAGEKALEGAGGILLLKDKAFREPYNPRPACLRVMRGHSDRVQSVALSADGKRGLSRSEDKSIRLWDLETGECLSVLKGDDDSVEFFDYDEPYNWEQSVVLTLDGKRGLSRHLDHTLHLWDLETGKCLRVLEGHSGRVESVALSADGKRGLSDSRDGTLRLWDLEAGKCLCVLKGHSGRVESVALSEDGKRGLSKSKGKSLRLWNLETGECLRVLGRHSDAASSIALSADGKRALSVSDDRTLHFWDLETGKCLRLIDGHGSSKVKSVTLSANGKRAISVSWWDSTLRLWDLETGECLRVMEEDANWVKSVALSADGRRVLSGGWDQTLRLWDLDTGHCLRILKGHDGQVKSVALSADGRRALSGSEDTTLRFWDLETGQCLHVQERGHTNPVLSVAFSPDDRWAFSVSVDKSLRWDLETGQCLRVLEGQGALVKSVALSADGKRKLAGLSLWDLETGKCLHVLKGHTDLLISEALSADGKRALSGSWDHTARFWDLEKGECLQVLRGHVGGVESVALSQDSRWGLSGSWDHTLRFWDLETGECLRLMEDHSGPVFSVALSADGKWGLSGSYDKSLRFWNLKTGRCLYSWPIPAIVQSIALQGTKVLIGDRLGKMACYALRS